MLSGVELHTLRGRLLAGVQQKAQRGDLALALPVGLLRQEDGRVVKAPDLAVQHALTLVFQTCLTRQSVSQVVRLLREQGLRLPRRHPNCETIWRTPTVAAVMAILRHPAHTGTFVYGKTRMMDADHQCIKGVVRTTPWSEAVRTPPELFFPDVREHPGGDTLDDFILQCGHP